VDRHEWLRARRWNPPAPRASLSKGHVVSAQKETLAEVFVADLPDDLTQPGDGPLAGTETRMPFPPKGCVQRAAHLHNATKVPGAPRSAPLAAQSPDGSPHRIF